MNKCEFEGMICSKPYYQNTKYPALTFKLGVFNKTKKVEVTIRAYGILAAQNKNLTFGDKVVVIGKYDIEYLDLNGVKTDIPFFIAQKISKTPKETDFDFDIEGINLENIDDDFI